MKKTAILFLLALCLAFTGCSKSAEVDALVKESDSTRDEMIQKLKANPTPAGIDDAEIALQAKRAAIMPRSSALKKAFDFQVSAELRDKMEKNIDKNLDAIVEAIQLGDSSGKNYREIRTKVNKLQKEYFDTFSIKID